MQLEILGADISRDDSWGASRSGSGGGGIIKNTAIKHVSYRELIDFVVGEDGGVYVPTAQGPIVCKL